MWAEQNFSWCVWTLSDIGHTRTDTDQVTEDSNIDMHLDTSLSSTPKRKRGVKSSKPLSVQKYKTRIMQMRRQSHANFRRYTQDNLIYTSLRYLVTVDYICKTRTGPEDPCETRNLVKFCEVCGKSNFWQPGSFLKMLSIKY